MLLMTSLAGLEATLREWSQEKEMIEARIRNLGTDEHADRLGKVVAVGRGKLITVLPFEVGLKESPFEPGLVGPVVTTQPVMVEVDRFRQLLRELDFVVTVFWKPHGKRWKVDKIRSAPRSLL